MSDDRIPWTATPQEFDRLWADEDARGIPDILTTMFAQQRQHMAAYSNLNPPNYSPMSLVGATTALELNTPIVQAAIREAAGYAVEELYEAINLLKNKPWKQTLRITNRDDFLEELADMWHFLIEMHIVAGVSSLEVFQAYFAKTLINNTRRETGY
jgi:hypothetical protein